MRLAGLPLPGLLQAGRPPPGEREGEAVVPLALNSSASTTTKVTREHLRFMMPSLLLALTGPPAARPVRACAYLITSGRYNLTYNTMSLSVAPLFVVSGSVGCET